MGRLLFLLKVLGFTVHTKGVDFGPPKAKAKAIQAIEAPKPCKQLKLFEKLSYVCRFIPVLKELLDPFQKLLMKNELF